MIAHYVLPDLQWMAILLQQLFAFTIALHFAWFLRMRAEVRPNIDANPSDPSATPSPSPSEPSVAPVPALLLVQNPPTLVHRTSAPKVASTVPPSLRHVSQLIAEEVSNESVTVSAPSAHLGLRRRWEVLLAHLPATIAHTPHDDDSDEADEDF